MVLLGGFNASLKISLNTNFKVRLNGFILVHKLVQIKIEPILCVCIKIKLFKHFKHKLLFKYFYLDIKDYIYTWIDIRIVF